MRKKTRLRAGPGAVAQPDAEEIVAARAAARDLLPSSAHRRRLRRDPGTRRLGVEKGADLRDCSVAALEGVGGKTRDADALLHVHRDRPAAGPQAVDLLGRGEDEEIIAFARLEQIEAEPRQAKAGVRRRFRGDADDGGVAERASRGGAGAGRKDRGSDERQQESASATGESHGVRKTGLEHTVSSETRRDVRARWRGSCRRGGGTSPSCSGSRCPWRPRRTSSPSPSPGPCRLETA